MLSAMDDRVERLLARISTADPADSLVARDLVSLAVELGASDAEILHAGEQSFGSLVVDLATRPPGEAVTLAALADSARLDPVLVRRAWGAFGLSAPEADEPVVAPDLAKAIGSVGFLAGLLGEEAAIGIARVIGSAGAQLAEALSSATRVGYELPQRDSGASYAEVIGRIALIARDQLPNLSQAVAAVVRRHIVAVSKQPWTADVARRAVTVDRVIGFVDLVGSTDILRTLTVAEVAANVNRFEQLIGDVVVGAGGRVVKLIGDEAMFVVADPVHACRLAVDLVAASAQPVRVGLALGEVIAFHGDFYGPTVNLAARLVAVAAPGTILVDESLAAAAGEAIELEPVAVGPLRGFPDVTTAHRIVQT
jgi:class 3 adenylate cyclase